MVSCEKGTKDSTSEVFNIFLNRFFDDGREVKIIGSVEAYNYREENINITLNHRQRDKLKKLFLNYSSSILIAGDLPRYASSDAYVIQSDEEKIYVVPFQFANDLKDGNYILWGCESCNEFILEFRKGGNPMPYVLYEISDLLEVEVQIQIKEVE